MTTAPSRSQHCTIVTSTDLDLHTGTDRSARMRPYKLTGTGEKDMIIVHSNILLLITPARELSQCDCVNCISMIDDNGANNRALHLFSERLSNSVQMLLIAEPIHFLHL